jgi:hypothetical protein
MIILKKLGASEEEQIAGLLHDASHTAFSHVIDFVMGDGKTEDFQDKQHLQFVMNSKLPDILSKYGYSADRIVDYHHFGILERNLPDLCADRVDYSLREFPANVVIDCLPGFTVVQGKIVFKNKRSALMFARNFLKLQLQHWGGFESVSRYRIFADVLLQALKEGTISKDDFWQDDSFVINKLVSSKNQKLQNILQVLRHKSLPHLDKSNVKVYVKFRYVDPLFIDNKKLIRLSKASKIFADELNIARRLNELGVAIPTISNPVKADI